MKCYDKNMDKFKLFLIALFCVTNLTYAIKNGVRKCNEQKTCGECLQTSGCAWNLNVSN